MVKWQDDTITINGHDIDLNSYKDFLQKSTELESSSNFSYLKPLEYRLSTEYSPNGLSLQPEHERRER